MRHRDHRVRQVLAHPLALLQRLRRRGVRIRRPRRVGDRLRHRRRQPVRALQRPVLLHPLQRRGPSARSAPAPARSPASAAGRPAATPSPGAPSASPPCRVVSTVPSTRTAIRSTGPCTVMVLTASPAPSVKAEPNNAPSAPTVQSSTCCDAVRRRRQPVALRHEAHRRAELVERAVPDAEPHVSGPRRDSRRPRPAPARRSGR